MREPYLIVVSGIPGVGKTTLAEKLANDLSYIFINKDGVLEKLWESLEWDGNERDIPKFRNATFEIIYDFVERSGKAGASVIIEANFNNTDHSPRIIELAHQWGFRIIYIHCDASVETAFGRFVDRQRNGDRHPLHPSRDTLEEYKEVFINGREHRLNMPGYVIEIDLNDFSTHNYIDTLKKVKEVINNGDKS